MSVEEHKTMISRLFEEALNQRNVAVIDELFAPDFVDHSAWPGQTPGPAGTKEGVTDILSIFPDLRVTFESVIAEGDEVATRETWHRTHTPTGRPATGTVLHFFRFRDGKIVGEWSEGWGWLKALGVSTAPGQDD